MRRRVAIVAAFVTLSPLVGACTGLVAGPEVAASTPLPISRDSAYVRARRGLTSETFSMDVVDSSRGHLTGTRFPSANAQLGTAASCRVVLALDLTGDTRESTISTTTRWVAPGAMSDRAPQVCEEERQQVLARLSETLTPPAP
ncbi:MAG TPA: hypothetical protein VH764_01255 [Gemmatimonadales bacterium]|jgi:hypothetical protein